MLTKIKNRRFSRTKNTSTLLLLVTMVLFAGSCKEPLPSYTDPSDYFAGRLTGTFVLTNNDNSVKFHLIIVNKFDETFSARARMEGTIEVTSIKNPDYRKTFFLTVNNLFRAKDYNGNSKVLTIDPGDSVDFTVSWNFFDDKNRDVREALFVYTRDPTCPQKRRIAFQEFFAVTGTMKLYDRADEILPPKLNFSLCHVDTWVPTKECPPIDEQSACKLIQ